MNLINVAVGIVVIIFSLAMVRRSIREVRENPKQRLFYFLDFLFLGYGVIWVLVALIGIIFILYGIGIVKG